MIRGWAAAGVSTLCEATSHYAVDPNPPNVALLALTLSIAGLVCVLLAGRRLGAVRTACVVALSQLPFHAPFSLGGHAAGPSSHVIGTAHAQGHALRPVPLAYPLPPRAWSPVRIISPRGPPALSV